MDSFVNTIITIGPYLVFVGAFLLIMAHQKSNEISHTLSKGQLAEGIVIELRDELGNTVETFNYHAVAPVVEFKTANGKYIHYSSTYQNPSPYKKGQVVKIYYYIYKSIQHFALEDDQTGTLPGILLRWGLVFCAVGLPSLVIKLSNLF